MVDRIPLIKEIDELLKNSSNCAQNLISYQKLKENDARVTFFKHVNVVLDSSIISLILANKYLGKEEWWKEIYNRYNLSKRPYNYRREFGYFDQIIMNGYYLFIFNSFEHSLRLICKRYDSALYQEQKNSLNALLKGMIKELRLKKRDKFIDLLTYLRNSMHNNGLFVPGGKLSNRKIVWNNTIYTFNEDLQIKDSKSDMWLSFIPISKEITIVFNELIDTNQIRSIRYFHDPTEHGSNIVRT
jgi:hypothetical protein